MLTHFPKTRLSELVGRLGGINRSDAVEQAKKQLETMRAKSDEVILASMTALEKVVYKPHSASAYSRAQMNEILALGDQIVTLAGTFSYEALDRATRSMCDVADGLARNKRDDVASIHVHMRAMRMLAPGATALPQEHVDMMLAELSKILTHHGFTGLSEGAAEIEEPDADSKPAGPTSGSHPR